MVRSLCLGSEGGTAFVSQGNPRLMQRQKRVCRQLHVHLTMTVFRCSKASFEGPKTKRFLFSLAFPFEEMNISLDIDSTSPLASRRLTTALRVHGRRRLRDDLHTRRRRVAGELALV